MSSSAQTGRVFVLQGVFDDRTGQGVYTERVIAHLSRPVKRISLNGGARRGVARIVSSFANLLYLSVALRSKDRVYWIISRSPKALYREAMLALILRRHAGRVTVHVHGNELHMTAQEIPDWVRKMLITSLENFKVIVLCEHIAENLESIGLKHSLKIIGNTVSGITPHRGAPTPAVLSPQKATLLYLSNLLPQKGILEAINVVEALNAQRFLDRVWILNIAGGWSGVCDANRKRVLDAIASSEHCIYHGFADQPTKEELFGSADIFLFPSQYPTEAFPLALVEALLSGLPAVTTSVGCIPSMVADCPHIAMIDDVDNLLPALCELASGLVAGDILVNTAPLQRMAGDAGPRSTVEMIEWLK